jgi:uncharacterized protein YcaQ
VNDYFRLPKTGNLARLEAALACGELTRVRVQGWEEEAWLHTSQLPLAEAAARGDLHPSCTTLLSPFDPLVWHRARVSDLFDFQYSIECYLPAAKRVYGYFSLPILHAGGLVGRVDAKAHRKAGFFEIKALHLEPRVPVDAVLIEALAGALQRCANWHQTPQVRLVHSSPPQLKKALDNALAG